jgi:oxygen-insensitive NAD(P)H nitroreductase
MQDKLSKENAKIMGVNINPFYGAPVIRIILANKAIPTYLCDGTLVS